MDPGLRTKDDDTNAELEPRPAEPEPSQPELEVSGPEPEPEIVEPQLEIAPDPAPRRERPQGMVPGRGRRGTRIERVSMRVLATGGIIGIDVILGAVLVDQAVAGWIVGLVVGLASVILAAVLWSSRQL
jgi:hypothetical protein